MMVISELIGSLFRGRSQSVTPQNGEIVDIYGRPIKDALEYFYPKQITGIPVFSVDSIYNHYRDLVKEVKKNSGIGEHRESAGVKKLDYLFTEVIKRYIEYIHMLPASENHHHSTPGGMIVHSLEASAHAQKFAKENKPESLGMQDLDRQSLPVYRYAAWLATFMHDAGKVLRDIVVDAVDVEQDGKNVRVSNSSPVPSWRPQKESLISWAKRFNVATYSVTYVKDRIHNQHNVDSVQLLQPVLGQGLALEYILSAPADVHSKLVRVLAGHDNGKDYLASAVRRGDMLSTSRNVAQSVGSTYLTEQSLSAPAKIYKAMKIAKQDWSYNNLSADVWVIGGEVYLRYSKAFHSIIKTANKNDLTLPNDLSTITMIMEESGITEVFDKQHKSVKFVQGQFSDKQLEGMLTGKEVVTWMELVKVKWRGLLFGDEPMPDSECGVFYFPEKHELVEVNALGELKAFKVPETNAAGGEENTKVASQLASPAEVPVIYDEKNPPPPNEEEVPAQLNQAPVPGAPSTKPNAKKIIEMAKQAPKKPKPKLVFKNAPKSEDADLPLTQEDKQSELASEQILSTQDLQLPENQHSDKQEQASDKTDCIGENQHVTSNADGKVSEVTKNKGREELTNNNNEKKDDSSVTVRDLLKHVKLLTTKQMSGKFIAINDALGYLNVEDKQAAMKILVESGVALLENNNPIVLLEKISGKYHQIIAINTQSQQALDRKPEAKRKARKQKATKKNADKQAQQANPKASSTTKESKLSETEKTDHNRIEKMVVSARHREDDVVDYGLKMRVKSARDGSLAFYIGKVLETYADNADQSDFVIEQDNQLAINATKLIETIKAIHPDSSFQFRHVVKCCKAAGVEVNRKQIDNMNFIQLPSTSILDIDIEV